jgi:hypothetical protein
VMKRLSAACLKPPASTSVTNSSSRRVSMR